MKTREETEREFVKRSLWRVTRGLHTESRSVCTLRALSEGSVLLFTGKLKSTILGFFVEAVLSDGCLCWVAVVWYSTSLKRLA